MTGDDIRDLYAYDRWATERLLGVLPDIDEETWSATNVVDERGLGGILVHHWVRTSAGGTGSRTIPASTARSASRCRRRRR
jgi:hypothetical protein